MNTNFANMNQLNILKRMNDASSLSKSKIVWFGIKFYLVAKIVCILAMITTNYIYIELGYTEKSFPAFGGNPLSWLKSSNPLFIIILMSIIAPVTEELAFRLGLSLKRKSASISIGFIFFVLSNFFLPMTTYGYVIKVIVTLLIISLVYVLTSDLFWERIKGNKQAQIINSSIVAFGLIHLFAFNGLTPAFFPLALITILQPLLAGTIITYYRMNLGFQWGLLLHIINNIPGIIILTMHI